jgi:hypothetical protein
MANKQVYFFMFFYQKQESGMPDQTAFSFLKLAGRALCEAPRKEQCRSFGYAQDDNFVRLSIRQHENSKSLRPSLLAAKRTRGIRG